MVVKRKSEPEAVAVQPVEPDLNWESARSDTIERFAYIPQYRDLLVRFKKGGDYVYRDVPADFVPKMRKLHPWSKVREEITKFPYEKIGGIRTEPLKGRGENKTLYGKAVEGTTTTTKPRARRTSTKAGK